MILNFQWKMKQKSSNAWWPKDSTTCLEVVCILPNQLFTCSQLTGPLSCSDQRAICFCFQNRSWVIGPNKIMTVRIHNLKIAWPSKFQCHLCAPWTIYPIRSICYFSKRCSLFTNVAHNILIFWQEEKTSWSCFHFLDSLLNYTKHWKDTALKMKVLVYKY